MARAPATEADKLYQKQLKVIMNCTTSKNFVINTNLEKPTHSREKE